MKTIMTTLLILLLYVGLAAATNLIDFNNTSDLTSLFNPSSTHVCTNAGAGGVANSGSVDTYSASANEIWTHKTGVELPGVGESITISAYFRNTYGSGYGGLGFASNNVNERYGTCMVSSPYSMGTYFHGGGGALLNNDSEYIVDWYAQSGDLPPNAWLKMSYTLTNQGSNLFDAILYIWNSDSNGNLGTLFTEQSNTGFYNYNFAVATTIYPYFGFSWSRFDTMDNFEMHTGLPVLPVVYSGAGAGTVASPYVITTPGQLNEVRNFLDSNFILGNDINLNVSPYNTGEGWVPIGGKLADYKVLDLSLATGGSFTITGMGMWDEPVTTEPITIPTNADEIEIRINEANMGSSISVLNANMFALYSIISLNLGSVVGIVDAYDVSDIPFSGTFDGNGKTISNLYINQQSVFATGLFGATNGSTITDLTLSGVNIDGRGSTGSLIGWGDNTVLDNCHSNGNVTAESWSGGLAGYMISSIPLEISNCSTSGSVTGNDGLGGLFGHIQSLTLNKSYSTCSVSSIVGNSGGLLGSCNYATINNSFARGAVSSEDGSNIGGLVGWAHTNNFTNCYSTGSITSPSQYKGGIFGFFYNSTATGCYWDTVTSGLSNATANAGGPAATGCNTDDMTYPYNAFSGWDFTNVWIGDVYPINGGYPMLRLETPDYLNGIDETVGDVVVTVTGGDAYDGSGYIPEYTGLEFVPNQTFTFVGIGILTINITTQAQFGAYWQSGAWHTVPNNAGLVTFVIDFDMLGKGELPVVLGDEGHTLPVELSSFTAIATQQKYVQLNWITQSETGVSGYYIYRSTSNSLTSAQVVSNLISAYNTSQEQAYVFTDKEVQSGTWYYWLQNMDMDGRFGFHGSISVVINGATEDTTPVIPLVTSIQNIYPNPFNPATTIAFGLAKAEEVNIQVYNVKGQLVRTLVSETKQADSYRITWNGTNDNGKSLPSGVYYVRMTAGKYSTTRKLVIMK